MTRDEVRAAGRRVVQWHQRFAGLFGRREAREHSLVYLKGLLSQQPRKSVEPIALRFARGREGGPPAQKNAEERGQALNRRRTGSRRTGSGFKY